MNIQSDDPRIIQSIKDREKDLYPDTDIPVVEEETPKEPQVKPSTFSNDSTKQELGWTLINPDIVPTQNLFYPSDFSLYCKSATVREIRSLSSIIDDMAAETTDKIQLIISKCSKVKDSSHKFNWKDICEMDQMFILLAIRDLTFSEIVNPLRTKHTCPNCSIVNNIDIFSHNSYFFTPDDFVMTYYNNNSRSFELELTTTGEQLSLTLPTIGRSLKIKEYIDFRASHGLAVDRDFIPILYYMNLDWRLMTNEKIDKIVTESYGWSLEKWTLAQEFIQKLRDCTDMKVISNCSSCGTEVTAPFSFSGGFRSFFLISNIFDRVR